MASGSTRGTIAVPQERDRPGQGLVGVRRVHVLVHVGQPGHAGHVLQPGGLRLRARARTRSCRSSWPRSRSRSWPSPTRVSSRPCRGPAATTSGRAGSSTGSRASLTGAVVGGDRRSTSSPMRWPGSTPSRIVAGDRRRRRRRERSAGSRAASASSWPPPAGGSSSRCGRRSTARSSTSSSSSRSPRWSSPPTACRSSPRRTASCSSRSSTIILTSALVALGMAGYARIQKLVPVSRPRSASAIMFVLMLVVEPGRLQGRLRPGQREPVRHLRRVRQDARRRGGQRRLGDHARTRRTSARTSATPCSRPSP